MSLNKDFSAALQYGLTADMTIARVAMAYLKDVFGIETSVEELSAAKSIAPISSYKNEVGIVYLSSGEYKFYPVTEDGWNAIEIASTATKEGVAYNEIKFSLDADLAVAYEPTCTVSSALVTLPIRSIKSALKDKKYTEIFYPCGTQIAADGTYKLSTTVKLNDDLNRIVISDKEVSYSLILKSTVTPEEPITIVSGEVFANGVKITGGEGVSAESIPAEIGFSLDVISTSFVGSKGAAIMEANDGVTYWAPTSVKNIMRSLAPREFGGFKVTVTGTRTKDSKTYPVVTVGK